MNLAIFISILFTIGVFSYGLILSAGQSSLLMFYDYASLVIVIGGTISAMVLSFDLKKIRSLVKVFFNQVFKGKGFDFGALIKSQVQILEAYRRGEDLVQLSSKVDDLFFKEGLELLSGGVLPLDQVIEVLEDRNDNIFNLYSEDSSKLKILGKYPPAFGMMGTTMGMIVLLANLSGTDAIKRVGPAMGICLITTLYGTVLANFFFLPFADNLTDKAKEIYLKNRLVIEGIKLISEKANPIYAVEKLNSHLRPGDRLDWKEIVGAKA